MIFFIQKFDISVIFGQIEDMLQLLECIIHVVGKSVWWLLSGESATIGHDQEELDTLLRFLFIFCRTFLCVFILFHIICPYFVEHIF